MYFEIIEEIYNIEVIAINNKIREFERLRKKYGESRWRKLKGTAKIRLLGGSIVNAELHWYEAHGLGRKEIKIKRIFI